MSGNQQLLEIVNVKNPSEKIGAELAQLYKYSGTKEDKENALWFIAPSLSPLRADSFVANLLQKALMKASFNPTAEVYYSSIVGTRKSSKSHEDNGGILFTGFPTQAAPDAPAELNEFRKTLLRWGSMIQPRCIVTFTLGRAMVRYADVPSNITDKLADICERPVYPFGQEPIDIDEDTGVQYKQKVEASFGQWCTENEIAWLDFTLDATQKDFEEVVQAEWKNFVGPSLKWLTEGLRFQPVVEEDPLANIEVIPALEMPPEFANL